MGARHAELQNSLYRCIVAADRPGAARLLGDAVASEGFRTVIAKVLDPTLRLVGDRFMEERMSLAQGYVASKVAEDLLERLDAAAVEGLAAPRKVAVLGNAEDDFHALGRRMVATFLRIEGWQVEDLGNDVLADAFVDRALETGARVIGVSAMMLTNALNIAKIREELLRRGLEGRIRLAVGGAVFVIRPDLIAEVGGDGTCRTAMEAPSLFSSLVAGTESHA